LAVYDPVVTKEQVTEELSRVVPQEQVKDLVTSCTNPYSASEGSHAVVVCTEWDEFKTLDWEKIHEAMMKPAFVFDGRKILPHEELVKIGFSVETIGKQIVQQDNQKI